MGNATRFIGLTPSRFQDILDKQWVHLVLLNGNPTFLDQKLSLQDLPLDDQRHLLISRSPGSQRIDRVIPLSMETETPMSLEECIIHNLEEVINTAETAMTDMLRALSEESMKKLTGFTYDMTSPPHFLHLPIITKPHSIISLDPYRTQEAVIKIDLNVWVLFLSIL